MPGQVLNVGATIQCPHVGSVSIVSSNTRVMLGGQPAATIDDTYPIAGCPFTLPGPTPHPCVKVQWLVPALRVLVNKKAVILQNSSGLCLSADQTPQGPPNVLVTQLRVKAS
jgi:uncharacterized Zn-binding protein involved in type VI secretion